MTRAGFIAQLYTGMKKTQWADAKRPSGLCIALSLRGKDGLRKDFTDYGKKRRRLPTTGLIGCASVGTYSMTTSRT